MTNRPQRRFTSLLLVGAGFALLPLAQAWAGACDDPTDTSPHPKQIAGCQPQAQPPINLYIDQHQPWIFKCTGTNGLFLGNDQGYFSPGYALDNNCIYTEVWTPQFDNQFSVTLTNACIKPETVVVTLGCMPGN